MKKLFSSILAALMLLSVLSMSVTALTQMESSTPETFLSIERPTLEDSSPIIGRPGQGVFFPREIGPNPGIMTPENMNPDAVLSQAEFDAMINNALEAAEMRASTPMTVEEMHFVNAVLAAYGQSYSASQSAFSQNSLNSLYNDLRRGNLIEMVLNFNQGVNDPTFIRAFNLANRARFDAQTVPEFMWAQDAARHFLWNFDMTREINQNTARIVGNNHEWGLVMVPYMVNFMNNRYNHHIQSGLSPEAAASRTRSEIILEIPGFKADMVRFMRNNYAFFRTFWGYGTVAGNDYMMDFWNNCYGRAYPGRGFTNRAAAFAAANNAWELIVDPNGVRSNHWHDIWRWDWYS